MELFINEKPRKRLLIVYYMCVHVLIFITLYNNWISDYIIRILLVNLFLCMIVIDFLLILFYFPVKFLIQEFKFDKKELIRLALSILIISLGVILFIQIYYSYENDIKQYDSTVYWIKLLNGSGGLYMDFPTTINTWLRSLASEYSDLATLPLILYCNIFGKDFVDYVTAITIFYYISSCILLTIYVIRVVKMVSEIKITIYEIIGCYLLCLGNMGLLNPVLSGYVDVIGVAIVLVFLNLILKKDLYIFSLKRNILFAILSLILFFSRRWYAFYLVGFYTSLVCGSIVCDLLKVKGERRSFKLIINLLIIAGLCLVFMCTVTPALFNLLLENNYGNIYLAYKTNNLWQDVWAIGLTQGAVMLILEALGFVLLLRTRKGWGILSLVLGASIVSLAMFERVQSMGGHHYYLVLPCIIILSCVGYLAVCNGICKKIKRRWVNGTILIIFCVAIGLNVSYATVPQVKVAFGKSGLFTSIYHPPAKIPGGNVIREVSKYLNGLDDGKAKVYFVASGGTKVSSELLKRTQMPDNIDALPNLFTAKIVDLRDGFPSENFLADYILLHTPFESEFQEEQKVVKSLWEMLEQNKNGYYSLDKEWAFLDGYLKLYKKIIPIKPSFIEYMISDKLKFYYPENSFVFGPNWFIALINTDNVYTYDEYSHALTFQYEGNPIKVDIYTEQKFKEIQFELQSWASGYRIIIVGDGIELMNERVPDSGVKRYSVDIANVQKLETHIVAGGGGILGDQITVLNGILVNKE